MGDQIEASILFSDIRGFREFTAKKGDKQAFKLLQVNNQLAQPNIKEHNGKLVKTYGDGMMVQFGQAHQAVNAGIHIQRHFNTYTQLERRFQK